MSTFCVGQKEKVLLAIPAVISVIAQLALDYHCSNGIPNLTIYSTSNQ